MRGASGELFIVYDEDSHDAIAVDPGAEAEKS